jgi:ribosomal protein L11 methyltransferase
MKSRDLWRLTVRTLPEAEEAVAELLQLLYGEPASSYTDLENGLTDVSAYLSRRPQWSAAERRQLKSRLASLRECGLNAGEAVVALQRVRGRDWAESWKRHFRPLVIRRKLLVKPSWSRKQPTKGQAVVVLDPGLSFGTGQHPTTAFCLDQIVAAVKPGCSLLDIGTGSGILAIAGAVLGYSPVHGYDYDPESLRVARANARQNGVDRKVRFTRKDLRDGGSERRKYSVVCANLTADLLVQFQASIISTLAPGGRLVLAGVLRSEFTGVRRIFEQTGLRWLAGRAEREWQSGCFELRKTR